METFLKVIINNFDLLFYIKSKKIFIIITTIYFFDRKKDGCSKRLTIYHLVFKCVD